MLSSLAAIIRMVGGLGSYHGWPPLELVFFQSSCKIADFF